MYPRPLDYKLLKGRSKPFEFQHQAHMIHTYQAQQYLLNFNYTGKVVIRKYQFSKTTTSEHLASSLKCRTKINAIFQGPRILLGSLKIHNALWLK
jgi:hypothetical protein